MEALELIKNRRSVRTYTEEPVSEQDIRELVEIAAYSPSWKNSQTVRYIAVVNEEIKSRIANEAVCGFEGNKRIITECPVLIVEATVDKRAGYERDGSYSTTKGDHWQSFDAGIAAQSFCLAAYEKGLGTVIMGIYEESKVKEILGMSEDMSVSSLIALGHPAMVPPMPKRKTVDELLEIK